MTDLDDAFVEAVAQTALQTTHHGTSVQLRAPSPEPVDDAPADDDESRVRLDGGRGDVLLEVVVGGDVVGAIVPVGDGYGVLVLPEDGEEPSAEQETLEDALDELGI